MRVLRIEVKGVPGAQGSKRHVGRGIMRESSKKVAPWRSDVRDSAMTAMTDVAWATPTGSVIVDITFRFRRPRSHYRTGKNAHLLRDSAPVNPTSRAHGDIDKLVRSTLDALVSAGVMADDSQVVRLYAEKMWWHPSHDGMPGASIEITAGMS